MIIRSMPYDPQDRRAGFSHALAGWIDWFRRPPVLLCLITVLAALLRIFHLGSRSLWLDEAMLYWFANGSFGDIIEKNAAYNSAPPLFTLLVGAVMNIGVSEAALRAVSCAAGVAAVPAMYFLAKQFFSTGWASFAALLVAVAPAQVQYSQQVREYSLAFLLAVGMLLAFCRFLKMRSVGSAAWLAAVVCVSLLTQYGLALLFAAINLVFFAMLLQVERPKQVIILWLPVLLVASATAAAVYQLSLKDHWVSGGRAAYYLAAGYWEGSLVSLIKMAVLNTEGIFLFAFPTQVIILACALGVLESLRMKQHRTVLWLFVAPITLTFAMALMRAYPYVGARQTIFLTPMVYIMATLGLIFVSRQQRARALTVLMMIFMVSYGLRYTAKYQFTTEPENIRPIVKTVLSSAADGDRIYVHSGATPAFAYYFQGQAKPWIGGAYQREEPEKYFQQLDVLLAEPGKLWLVFTNIQEDELQSTLKFVGKRRSVRQVHDGEGARLYLVQ